MKYKYNADSFLVRNTITEEKSLQFYDYVTFLNYVKEDKKFQEQLFVASRSLYDSLQKYYNNMPMKKKKIRQMSESIYKYYKRSIDRSTPFGLFSKTSVGEFSDENQLILNSKAKKSILFDLEWLTSLVFKIEKKYYRKLYFKLNAANYRYGNRVVQIYSINNNETEELNIKFTKVYQIIQKSCLEKYVSFNQILNSILKVYGLEYKSLAENYIVSLIENHFLLSNLNYDLVSDFDRKKFISEVKKVDEEDAFYSTLCKIVRLIEEYSILQIGEGIGKLEYIYGLMSSLVKTNNFLQIDLHDTGHAKLNFSLKKQIVEFSEFLSNLSTSVQKSYLDNFKDLFLEKYGLYREVQLVELFDSNMGLGAPYGYTHPQNYCYESTPKTIFYSETEEKMYLNELELSLESGKSIQLNKFKRYYKNLQGNVNKVNQGFELFFNINYENNNCILSLGSAGCSKNLGASSGRFSVISDELKEYHRDNAKVIEDLNSDLGYNTCEIVFLPENLRHANVMRTDNIRQKTLSLFTYNRGEQIKLSDIYIGIDAQNNFYAKECKSGKLVKFYSTNMYNQLLFSNELRFLCEISLDNHFGMFPWEIIFQKFSYVPRIVYGNLIVAPARWRLSGDDIDDDIEHIIIKHNLPLEFYVDNQDNRILINQSNHLDKELFASIIRKAKLKNEEVNLSECISAISLLNKKNKRYAADIVVPVKCSDRSQFKVENIEMPEAISISERQKIPFEDWLYLKLYMSSDRQEEFLSDVMPSIFNLVKEKGGKAFYIRYTDPKFHIRLRIKGQDLYSIYTKIQKILQKSIDNNLISTVDISTYDREIERYGGRQKIDLVEDIFCIDTEVVINALSLLRTQKIHLTVEELAIVLNYFYLKVVFKNQNDKIIHFLENVCPKHTVNKNSEKHKNMSLVQDYVNNCQIFEILPNLHELAQKVKKLSYNCKDFLEDYQYAIYDSIIHVHNNRLIGIDREKEEVIYDIIRGLVISEEFRNGMSNG